MTGPHLVYFADPMCSWCWGFSPVIAAIERRFCDDLPIRLVLGGLRPGTTEPMDAVAKASMRTHWQHVHEASGQPFDFGFFARQGFVYDTEPACRAVVVMRRRSMADGLVGLRRIHSAFYAANRDVTEAGTLGEIAAELGLARAPFLAEMEGEAARQQTGDDFALTQHVGVSGFPTIIAGSGQDNEFVLVTHGFQPAERIIPEIEKWRETLG